MSLIVPQVLSREEVAQLQNALRDATFQNAWQDGKATAGSQAAMAKNNSQLDEDSRMTKTLQGLVLQALSRSSEFFGAALPQKVFPPLFNRYAGAHNAFGSHVDNAVRTHRSSGQHARTDLSFTLFLSEPTSYEGGELVMETGLGEHSIKLPAGSLVLYPSYVLHRVNPVTQGERLACFSWVQSMVRSSDERQVLFELDQSIQALRSKQGDNAQTVRLTQVYHNLLRMWADV